MSIWGRPRGVDSHYLPGPYPSGRQKVVRYKVTCAKRHTYTDTSYPWRCRRCGSPVAVKRK